MEPLSSFAGFLSLYLDERARLSFWEGDMRFGPFRVLVFCLTTIALTAIPSFAQMDLSGQWGPVVGDEDLDERVGGPELGEYMGMPINDASRARADLWDSSIQSLPEWQCRPHGVDYITRGPSDPYITAEIDPVTRNITAYHMEWLRSVDRPIYMDGRPHPGPNEPHTWSGFSTGTWVGDVLSDPHNAHQGRLHPKKRSAAKRSRRSG